MTERVQFVVHDASGMILRTGQASADMVAIQAFEPGTSVTVVDDTDGVDRDTFRVVDGGLVRLPPKPAPFMTFDTEAGAWVDPRTDADRASEHEARRSAASMTKGEFLQACIANMMLNPKEASIAARGDIPEPFQAAVAFMTPEQQDDLRVIWPVTTRVCRMDPLLLAVAEARGFTDDTLDKLFGLN